MSTLSLVMITLDERDRIARAIRSVPFADEVLVLDCGSTDGTCARARALGARVVRTDWPGFVAQKNRALQLARGDLVLALDADEWLGPDAQAEVRALLRSPGPFDAWSFPRLSRWMGRPIRHGSWYPDRRIRLVRNGRGRWVGPEPADTLWTPGPVGALRHPIEHDPYRSLAEHLRTIDRYSRAHAASLHRRGVRPRPWTPFVRASWHFTRHVLLRGGWRDGWRGVALGGLGALHTGLKWSRARRCASR